MNRFTGFAKRNSKEYELAYFDALINDWNTKKQSLVAEFNRIKGIYNGLVFDRINWTNDWQHQKPARSVLKIVDAIMFLDQADFYLKSRRQQVVLTIQNCSDPIAWAKLTQQVHSSFEILHATSPANAQALADAVTMLSFDLDLTLDFLVTKNKTSQSKTSVRPIFCIFLLRPTIKAKIPEKTKTGKKAKKRALSPNPKHHPSISEMAKEIQLNNYCNPTTGKIRSDAFVLMGYLVTIKEQQKVQITVNKLLGIDANESSSNAKKNVVTKINVRF